MIRSIPLKLLIHTVTYEEYIPGDEWTPGYKPAVTLSNVRLQFGSDLKRNTNGEQILYNALLFYDVRNSSSSDPFEFVEQSKLTFEGKVMTVKKVNPIYAFTLHHWEIQLV